MNIKINSNRVTFCDYIALRESAVGNINTIVNHVVIVANENYDKYDRKDDNDNNKKKLNLDPNN